MWQEKQMKRQINLQNKIYHQTLPKKFRSSSKVNCSNYGNSTGNLRFVNKTPKITDKPTRA